MNFNKMTIEELSYDDASLVHDAIHAKKHAYCPYSDYPVGAAVETISHKIYTAANMENASYGLTVCAEVGAIQAAVSNGEREILKIAIAGGKDYKAGIAKPCGRCRQLIYEFSGEIKDVEIILSNASATEIVKTNIRELLTYPFGPEDLGSDDQIS